MTTKLKNLHPEFRYVNDGGDLLYEITFDCPKCGAPWRIYIKARLNGPRVPDGSGIWAWTASPFSNVPPKPIDWDSVSISPSIRLRGFSAHGSKRSCDAHFNVTNGEVTPA